MHSVDKLIRKNTAEVHIHLKEVANPDTYYHSFNLLEWVIGDVIEDQLIWHGVDAMYDYVNNF